MESAWRGLEDLVNNTNFKADITIDLLDVAKEELTEDFENNSSNIFSSALFDKVYIQEYDQYGGRPFGVHASACTSSPRRARTSPGWSAWARWPTPRTARSSPRPATSSSAARASRRWSPQEPGRRARATRASAGGTSSATPRRRRTWASPSRATWCACRGIRTRTPATCSTSPRRPGATPSKYLWGDAAILFAPQPR